MVLQGDYASLHAHEQCVRAGLTSEDESLSLSPRSHMFTSPCCVSTSRSPNDTRSGPSLGKDHISLLGSVCGSNELTPAGYHPRDRSIQQVLRQGCRPAPAYHQ